MDVSGLIMVLPKVTTSPEAAGLVAQIIQSALNAQDRRISALERETASLRTEIAALRRVRSD